MSPETDQTDPEEVKALLAKMGYQPDAPAEQETSPADEDPLAALNMAEHAEENIRRIPISAEALDALNPPEKTRELRLNTEIKPETDPWTRRIPQLGVITVTQQERDDYQKALLFDTRFIARIDIPFGSDQLSVVLQSLYTSEKEVTALAIDQIARNYPVQSINNVGVATTHYFRALILTQVISYGSTVMQPYDARPPAGICAESSPKVAELANLARISFGDMHQAKYKALMKALQIFETKQVILEDAVGNRDFWQPADAS